jgi:hypothetical protein
MPKQKGLVEKIVEKFKSPKNEVTQWGGGLAGAYKSKQVDQRQKEGQIRDMFDPSQSKFAEVAKKLYERIKRNK